MFNFRLKMEIVDKPRNHEVIPPGISTHTGGLYWYWNYPQKRYIPFNNIRSNGILTIKEEGCTGFYFPVLRDCTRARLSWGARLPKGQAVPRGRRPQGTAWPEGSLALRDSLALVQSWSTGKLNPVHPDSFIVNNIISYLVILYSSKVYRVLLLSGSIEPNGHGSHLSFVVIYSHLVGLIEIHW